MAQKSIVICICGMAGSGKSHTAKRLASKYGLKYYSGGDVLKALAMREGYKGKKRGWWESKEGIRFLEHRGRDLKFDMAVDEKLLEVASQGNVVLDSWTMPWLLEKAFKIWLEAPLRKRAERISERDGISIQEAVKALKKKEYATKIIYKKLYDFDLGEDFAPFHLLLDTDNLNREEVFNVLSMVVDNLVVKSSEHY